jgi:CHU domain-containing protein
MRNRTITLIAMIAIMGNCNCVWFAKTVKTVKPAQQNHPGNADLKLPRKEIKAYSNNRKSNYKHGISKISSSIGSLYHGDQKINKAVEINSPQTKLSFTVNISNKGSDDQYGQFEYRIVDYYFRMEKGIRSYQVKAGSTKKIKIDFSPKITKRIFNAMKYSYTPEFKLQVRIIDLQENTIPWSTRLFKLKVPVAIKSHKLQPYEDTKYVNLPIYGRTKLIDRIECWNPDDPHAFQEGGAGFSSFYSMLEIGWKNRFEEEDIDRFSKIKSILNKKCRVTQGQGWFGYCLNRKKISEDKHYILKITYPEDTSRTFLFPSDPWDIGATAAFHTGKSIGSLWGRSRNIEQGNYKLSGKWEEAYISFSGNAKAPWFFVFGAGRSSDPYSKGAAIHDIELYEIEDINRSALTLNYPPEELPRRELIYTMVDHKNHFEANQIPLLKSLGYDTYLLTTPTFGTWESCWDTKLFNTANPFLSKFTKYAQKHGYKGSVFPIGYRHHRFIDEIADDFKKSEMNMLIGIESMGSPELPEEALIMNPDGKCNQQRIKIQHDKMPKPGWIPERKNSDRFIGDIVHPATKLDFFRKLDEVVGPLINRGIKLKGLVFQGDSAFCIGWSLYDINQFSKDTKIIVSGTDQKEKAHWILKNKKQQYLLWWQKRKRCFFKAVQKKLDTYQKNMRIYLYNWNRDLNPLIHHSYWMGVDPSKYPNPILTDKGPDFSKTPQLLLSDENLKKLDLVEMIQDLNVTSNFELFGGTNPELYREDNDFIYFCPVFYRYQASNKAYQNFFRTGAGVGICINVLGLESMTRRRNPKRNNMVWKIVHGGAFSMTEEVLSMVASDPVVIYYPRWFVYENPFPKYVRRFNKAYTALPAIKPVIIDDALNVADSKVVVKKYPTQFGNYLAVINAGYTPKEIELLIDIPANGVKNIYDFVAEKNIPFSYLKKENKLKIRINIDTMQLKSYHLIPLQPQEIFKNFSISPFFSPNGDGRYDTLEVSAEWAKGVKKQPWKLEIYNDKNALIWKYEKGGTSSIKYSWNGIGENKTKLKDGQYTIVLSDINGQLCTSKTFIIDTSPPPVPVITKIKEAAKDNLYYRIFGTCNEGNKLFVKINDQIEKTWVQPDGKFIYGIFCDKIENTLQVYCQDKFGNQSDLTDLEIITLDMNKKINWQFPLKFDFGAGSLAKSFISVCREAYNPYFGYGWKRKKKSNLTDRDRLTRPWKYTAVKDYLNKYDISLHKMLQDFAGGSKECFVIDIPNGKYKVTVFSGDLCYSGTFYELLANGKMVLSQQPLAKGEIIKKSFNIIIKNNKLELYSPVRIRLNGILIEKF